MLITKNLNSEANIAYSFDVNQYDDTTLNGQTNLFLKLCQVSNWYNSIYDDLMISKMFLGVTA